MSSEVQNVEANAWTVDQWRDVTKNFDKVAKGMIRVGIVLGQQERVSFVERVKNRVGDSDEWINTYLYPYYPMPNDVFQLMEASLQKPPPPAPPLRRRVVKSRIR